jgi:hypothetical protein
MSSCAKCQTPLNKNNIVCGICKRRWSLVTIIHCILCAMMITVVRFREDVTDICQEKTILGFVECTWLSSFVMPTLIALNTFIGEAVTLCQETAPTSQCFAMSAVVVAAFVSVYTLIFRQIARDNKLYTWP